MVAPLTRGHTPTGRGCSLSLGGLTGQGNMTYALLHSYLKQRHSNLALGLLGMPSGRLLDVGSGDGEDLRHLAALGWRAVGIDPFQRSNGVPFVQGSADQLPFQDSTFDALSCVLVLPHIKRIGSVISEA